MEEFTCHTLTEKWTTGDSHRLVYGPLEVHNAFCVEVDGRPYRIPACVVSSGNFEFFETKAELGTILGVKKGPAAKKMNPDIATIEKWMENFLRKTPEIKCEPICANPPNENLTYAVTDASGNSRVMDIIAATNREEAHAGFADTGNYKYFKDKTSLHAIIAKMLTRNPLDPADIDSIEQHVIKFLKTNTDVTCKIVPKANRINQKWLYYKVIDTKGHRQLLRIEPRFSTGREKKTIASDAGFVDPEAPSQRKQIKSFNTEQGLFQVLADLLKKK
jgi:hypothetical protein